MEKENVFCGFDCKNVLAIRLNEQTLLISKRLLSDSDQSIIEDQNGFRYKRNINIETLIESKLYYIFSMI